MKYSRASYVSGNPQRAVLGCVYMCTDKSVSLYILWNIAKSHVFDYVTTDEVAKLFQLPSIWTQLFHSKSACISDSYSHFGTRSKPLQDILLCFLTWKKTLFMNRHTKLRLKWAQNPKFCSFTSSFMQNQGNSVFIQLKLEIFCIIIS